MSSFRMEQKNSLTRKHAIADAMERMKVTGDTKMLDRIFASSEKKSATLVKDDDDDEKAPAA